MSGVCDKRESGDKNERIRSQSMIARSTSEQHKMRSQLAAQFMPFFRLIARILTFRDKKYRILTFCDKTELYLTVLQQNNVEACLRCEASLSFVPSLPNAQLQLMPACDIGSI